MPNHRRLALTLSSLVALLMAAGCSSSDGGSRDNPNVNPFVPGAGGAASTGGTANAPVGSAGTGVVATGGTGNEGQGGSSLVGAGGTGAAVGGAGGSATVTDVIAEPGPGFFQSGAWKGYAWTAIESDPVTGATTITPADFTTHPDGDPFCLNGTVAADPEYQGFAMLGFNINQAGVPEVEGTEPTIGTAVPTGNGIAFTFSQTTASPLRVQIQGLNPADATQRFCAAVPLADAQGRAFIPYDQFHQTCYDTPSLTSNPAGFYGFGGTRTPIAAVSFQVPGDLAPVPFNFCIAGFADAADINGAPAELTGGGLVAGTLATNFGRAKVRGGDGKSYVVQNNAWNPGAPEGSQRISFSGNSFTVTQQSNGGFGNIPISFPSIFVGRNGNRGVNETFTTTLDDGLPKAISAINSIQTTLTHNGGQGGPGGDYNVTYDIWFAGTAPAGEYDDASAAFLMVWLRKPAQNPIGLQPFVRNVQIAGAPGTWDIWVGRRGENGAETNLNDDAPVISYVATATITNFQADLKAFFNDAVSRSGPGLNGFQFTNNLVLTEIFGGAEIWSGAQGLTVENFTVNVQ
jgi:hypothetical protein